MAVNVSYEIGESIEYADTPLIYRVVDLEGTEISRDYATFEEIAANPDLEDEYISALREYFINKANIIFSAESLSELDSSKIFSLYNCTVYLLQKLSDKSRDPQASEE